MLVVLFVCLLFELTCGKPTQAKGKVTVTTSSLPKTISVIANKGATVAPKNVTFVVEKTVAVQETPVKIDLKVTPDSVDNGPTAVSVNCSVEDNRNTIYTPITTLKRQILSETYPEKIAYIMKGSPKVWSGFDGNITLSGKIDVESNSKGYLEITFLDFSVKDLGLYICVFNGFDKDFMPTIYTAEARVVEGKLSQVAEKPEEFTYIVEKIIAAQDTPVKIDLMHDSEDGGLTTFSFRCSFKDLHDAYIDLSRKVSSEEEYIAGVHASYPESISIHHKFNDRVKLPGKIVFKSNSEAYFELIISDFSVSDLGLYICMVYGRNKFGKYTFHTAEARVLKHEVDPDDTVFSSFVYENVFYMLIKSSQETDISTAQIVCERNKFYLTEVNSVGELQAIANKISPHIVKEDMVRIAGQKEADTDDWLYQGSHKQVNFFAWGPGEPVQSYNHNCMALHKTKVGINMVAVPCYSKNNITYILCEHHN